MIWGLWLGNQDWSYSFQSRGKILIGLTWLQVLSSLSHRARVRCGLSPAPGSHCMASHGSRWFQHPSLQLNYQAIPDYCPSLAFHSKLLPGLPLFPRLSACPLVLSPIPQLTSLGLLWWAAFTAASAWSRTLHHFSQTFSQNLFLNHRVRTGFPFLDILSPCTSEWAPPPRLPIVGFVVHARTLDYNHVYPSFHSINLFNDYIIYTYLFLFAWILTKYFYTTWTLWLSSGHPLSVFTYRLVSLIPAHLSGWVYRLAVNLSTFSDSKVQRWLFSPWYFLSLYLKTHSGIDL